MASGNSWQVYQELGGVPASAFEALKDLPQRRRRKSEPRQSAPAGSSDKNRLLITSPSASNVGYCNYAYHRGGTMGRSRSLSQTRVAPKPAKIERISPRRSSVSFRIAKEKGRQLWHRAKTFLDVNVLAGVISAITPPPSPRTWSASSTRHESEMDDSLFTTASDLSGSDDEFKDFSQIETNMENEDDDFMGMHQKRTQLTVPCWRPDPNCPVHGTGIKRLSERRVITRRSPSLINDKSIVYERKRLSVEPRASLAGKRKMASAHVEGSAAAPFMVKLARRRHKATLSSNERIRVEREKSQIRRNLFTLSVAFLFLISAFQGLQNLQTTIHGESGLGAISLSAVYSGLVISCLITPPYLLNRIGCKLTLVLSMCTFSIYILTHFIPKWYSLIPGSLLAGFGAAPLWAAKCSYLSEIGFRYAELNLESSNVVIVTFFGIFFMIVHLGQVFGNAISSWILKAAMDSTEPEWVDGVYNTCGHFFISSSHLSPVAKLNLARPSANAVYSLYGAYFCCALVAALIIAMFLSQLKSDVRIQKEEPRFKLDIWNTTLQHLKKPRHLLLVPLTIFNGMQQAFFAGEFTKAYVGCCMGISEIGYVMISYGSFDAVCSLVFGPLIKLFGRMPLLMFGAVVDMLMIFTLLVWPPNPVDTALFYVIAACWGMADGVWSTQINGLWVVKFADNLAAAFANYRLWESVGFIIAFSYTPLLTTETKLYILLAMLYIGMIGYGLIEMWEPLEEYAVRLKQKLHKKRSLPNSSNQRHAKMDRVDLGATQNLLGTDKNDKTMPIDVEETDL